MYYVYILKCSDGKLYTGCTNDLPDRIQRHERGYVTATEKRRPVELLLSRSLANIELSNLKNI